MAEELDREVKMEKRVKEESGAEFSHLGSVSKCYLILKLGGMTLKCSVEPNVF